MSKRLIFVIVVLLLIGATFNIHAQDATWELTETAGITRLNFPFSMDYPSEWHVKNGRFNATQHLGTAIAENKEDLTQVFDSTFQIQGYVIVFEFIDDFDELSLDNSVLQDLTTPITALYSYEEPAEVFETMVMWQLPALSMRTTDAVGNAVVTVYGFDGGGKIFVLSLIAPSDEALNAFLPTWDAIVESTLMHPVVFPTLTGPYQVGRTEYHLVDENRDEIFTTKSDDIRELMLRVYYPASPGADDQPAPYVEGYLREVLSLEGKRIPAVPWDLVISHTFTNVPVAEDMPSYPVLLFSPGASINPLFYTAIVEQVTSHGYIIVVLSHPYCVDSVVFPDDSVAEMRGCRIPSSQSFEVWVQDALFVLNQLTRFNDEDVLLTGRMDLAHIGMFGHSYGGATSVEAAYQDDRILAAINMDGAMFGDVIENGITQPFMMMMSDWSWQELQQDWDELINDMITQATTLCESSEAGYIWTLQKSAHGTFSDVAMLASLGNRDEWQYSPAMIGHVEPYHAQQVTSTYIVAFFDKHVKGEEVPLLDGPSDDYPDVIFEVCQAD